VKKYLYLYLLYFSAISLLFAPDQPQKNYFFKVNYMKSLKVIFTTTILTLSLMFSGLLSAQEILNTGNIYVGGVGYFSDTDRNIDDDLGVVLGGDADLDFYRVGLNYHFNQINGWRLTWHLALAMSTLKQLVLSMTKPNIPLMLVSASNAC